jgi:hypothetical protein
LRGDWETASRNDLLLFRQAILEDWPVPPERRGALMHAAVSGALHEGSPVRVRIAAARVALAADEHNRDLLKAAGRKVPVEACYTLPAGVWASLPRSGIWSWEDRAGAVGYTFDQALSVLHLQYTLEGPPGAEPEPVAYAVQLEARPTRIGGLRWWFLCPLMDRGRPCDYRAAALYLPPGQRYFGCRHCYELTYASRNKSRRKANATKGRNR